MFIFRCRSCIQIFGWFVHANSGGTHYFKDFSCVSYKSLLTYSAATPTAAFFYFLNGKRTFQIVARCLRVICRYYKYNGEWG